MGSFSIWHWMIVLLVVIMIFGTRKLRNLGSDLGGAVKGFKEGMQSGQEATSQISQEAKSIESEVSGKMRTSV